MRGRKGPLNLFVPGKTVHHLTRKWFESAQAIGLPLNPDFNGGKPGWRRPVRIHHSRRPAAFGSPGLPPPAMKRPNLRVITGAQVTGLTFDGARATGVTYKRRQVR
jgi:choline dehydrogenase